MTIKVIIDTREQTRTWKIKKYFAGDWEFETSPLEIGDYICGNVIVEWKNTDITDIGHLNRQARAMVQTGLNCHLIIEHPYEVTRLLFQQRAFKGDPLPGFLASLSAMGLKVWHCDTEENAFKLMEKIFIKENDGKDRTEIKFKTAQIKGTTTERIYASFPEIGDTKARELAQRWPIPNDFFSLALECRKWTAKDWKLKRLGRYQSILKTVAKEFYGVE